MQVSESTGPVAGPLIAISDRSRLPGKSSPLGLLELSVAMRNPYRYLQSRYQSYGPVSQGRYGPISIVDILGPEATETVLMNQEGAFSSKDGWTVAIGPFFGGGLMLRDGQEHLTHRRIMQMAFRREALERYLGLMNPEIDALTDQWVQDGGSRQFRMFPTMKKLTLDLASLIFLGEKLGPVADQLNRAFVDTVAAGGIGSLIRLPVPFTPYWRGLRGRQVLEGYFYGNLDQKRRSKSDDFFAQFCQVALAEENQLSDKEVVDHMIFLLMAAHDTTNMTLNTMVYHLAQNPEWQDRCRAEASQAGPGPLTFADLPGLNLIERVMKESLRLIPPVPGLMRMTVRDTCVAGVRIPAGKLCAVYPVFSHHLEEWWPDHRKFDPDRFLPERAEHKAHKFLYIPFGGGVHKCLGMHFADMQVKAIIVQLLNRYRWRTSANYKLKIDNKTLPKPADGLRLHVERISN